ncbi:uncharacterized protein LMH87_008338 [Akanthomyces muscarius]|uniref:Uncharacterized protein n=1 Tax=Akanthomyces muscarius TaxID=2231603 RepID=A0A9W8UQS7_AKAMU|nr:uncharacterized protein LMH87_008338 [Akanthomyces muscarius]KAJ4159436.1 hypothetical protein LMH87_008338 [Akanthomyces muscarius]
MTALRTTESSSLSRPATAASTLSGSADLPPSASTTALRTAELSSSTSTATAASTSSGSVNLLPSVSTAALRTYQRSSSSRPNRQCFAHPRHYPQAAPPPLRAARQHLVSRATIIASTLALTVAHRTSLSSSGLNDGPSHILVPVAKPPRHLFDDPWRN